MKRLERRYQDVRHLIRDADLLLFRDDGLFGKAIALAGRSEYCHAAKAHWVNIPNGVRSVLVAIETLDGGIGGRVYPLSKYVAEYPGAIDVYETNPDNCRPDYDRAGSAAWMWRNIPGTAYGYRSIWRSFLTHAPILRMFFRSDLDDQKETDLLPVCSVACARADRLGGKVDPVPNLADDCTEPGDLARSPFYRYRFTLVA